MTAQQDLAVRDDLNVVASSVDRHLVDQRDLSLFHIPSELVESVGHGVRHEDTVT